MTNKEINALKWRFVWYGSTVGEIPRGGRIVLGHGEELLYVGESKKQCDDAEALIAKHNADLENLRDIPKDHYCSGTGCCPG